MIQTLDNDKLSKYVRNQLVNFFPDELTITLPRLRDIVFETMLKVNNCFQHISLPGYRRNKLIFFNHLNSDHYTVFLYYLSNISYKENEINLATKLFYLNKSLNSFHCMYDTELPDIFIVSHGVGTVLGKASYSNFFVVTQGCTVGANAKLQYPKISERVIMYPNSSILGSSKISNNVISSNNSMVLNANIKANSLITGQHPNLIVKEANQKIFSNFFTF